MFNLFTQKSILPSPYMSTEDIQAIEKILKTLPCKKRIHVFEYGSGGSTLYFSKFLRDTAQSFCWIALEHDVNWASNVVSSLQKEGTHDVQVVLKEIPGIKAKKINKWKIRRRLFNKGIKFDYSGYTKTPTFFDVKFDLVIIDGRDRKNCIDVCWPLMAPGGKILFHDAWRDYYKCAFSKWDTGYSLTENLWCLEKSLA